MGDELKLLVHVWQLCCPKCSMWTNGCLNRISFIAQGFCTHHDEEHLHVSCEKCGYTMAAMCEDKAQAIQLAHISTKPLAAFDATERGGENHDA